MGDAVTVNIFNSEYKLRGDDAEKIRNAAEVVDSQMRYVASRAPMQPATTTAVLAALNTAEQLLEERSRLQEQSGELAEKIESLTSSLQELLTEEKSD